MIKIFLSNLKAIFLSFLDWLAIYSTSRASYARFSLCVVRADNIGDFVIWLPSASLLCQEYSPNTQPLLICSHYCADLAIASGLFAEVISVNMRLFTSNYMYRWTVVSRVSRLGVINAIQPTYSRTFDGDSLIRASRAKNRIGSLSCLENISSFQKRISDRWYTSLVTSSSGPLEEILRNCEFLQGLGITHAMPIPPLLEASLAIPENLRIPARYFVIFPGASSPIRQWPLDSFIAAGTKVAKKYGLIPVACGGLGDMDLCEQLCAGLSEVGSINLAGQTSLVELAEVIRRSDLLISNETSAIHIACAVNTPSVCILGGGHYGRFVPYPKDLSRKSPFPVIHEMDCFGCNWKCPYNSDRTEPVPCVRQVDAGMVINAAEQILNAVKREV